MSRHLPPAIPDGSRVISFTTRLKTNAKYRVVKRRSVRKSTGTTPNAVFTQIRIAMIAYLLASFYKVPVSLISDIESYLRESTFVEKSVPVEEGVFEEESDPPVLGVAAASGSSYIITGDKALISLKEYKDIDIISPRSFWKIIKKKANN